MANASAAGPANRLARESSPYLLHHAHDPVDWYAWGPEALERARLDDKPILLSIGYAACHWCHRMQEESFQDAATAALMNELFVNVKVDREERPDLDRIYQLAHQVLVQRSGGWPLTMFLSPEDQQPFFGGTYFPKDARYGMPAFRDILKRVAEYWREQAPAVREQNAALMQVFDELNAPPVDAGEPLTGAPIAACRQELQDDFDDRYGGFGNAPKFPHPATLSRLLRDWHATAARTEPDLHALYMSTLTLRRMGEGGLFDQLGGGFFRYSTDQYWMIPHFEKMLYDNGALLAVYAQAAVATGDPFYARIAGRTADWLLREMQAPSGGFFSSYDADSEGHEGRFYAWDVEDVRRVVSPAAFDVFARRYGLDREPNFEGAWHLHAHEAVEAIAESSGKSVEDVETLIDLARGTLLDVRAKRAWPARDDKVLTSWNALAIRGLALAARSLQRADLATAATRAVDFIRSTLWRDGRLLAAAKDERGYLDAYLDDHVFLADALLELLQVRWRSQDLAFARELVDAVLDRFEDAQNGGFFFTAVDHEALIHRPKAFSDEATPSGNGVAAFVLQRLGWLLGETRYLDAAERTLRAGWKAVEKFPHAHPSLLAALEERLSPAEILVLRGDPGEIARWQRELDRLWAPRRLTFAIPANATDLPPSLADKAPQGNAVAYVCRGFTCSAPVESLSALVRDLKLRLEDD